MGDMVKVMDRIHELYQQYADGLIMEEECLHAIRTTCEMETASIVSVMRLKEQGFLNRIADLTRDLDESRDLLEVVVGAKVSDLVPSDTIPASAPDTYMPPVLFETIIPPVVVGDEVQYEVVPPGELFPSRVKAEEVAALGRWEGEGGCSLTPR
jgi:hypothetical protein